MKTKYLLTALLLMTSLVSASTTVNLSGTGRFKAFDPDTGALLAGGKLQSYVCGTTTPSATYADSTGAVANTNPVILDGSGEAQVWLDPAICYKLVLKKSDDSVIWTLDNVNTPAAGVFTTLTVSGTVSFPSLTLTASTGTPPLTVSSTTKVSNLNADKLDDGDWANPGVAIGSGTRVPSTSQFTSLDVSGASVFSGGSSITNPTIVTGIANDGSGFKHKRTPGCATAASVGATCDTTITWGTAFADGNYTAVCFGAGNAGGVPVGLSTVNKVGASIQFRTYALTATAAQFTEVHCIAVHD